MDKQEELREAFAKAIYEWEWRGIWESLGDKKIRDLIYIRADFLLALLPPQGAPQPVPEGVSKPSEGCITIPISQIDGPTEWDHLARFATKYLDAYVQWSSPGTGLDECDDAYSSMVGYAALIKTMLNAVPPPPDQEKKP